MSNKVEISEYEFVTAYHILELNSKYTGDPERDANCLCDIFAYFGLTINELSTATYNKRSPTYKTIYMRYKRIVEKIKSNKSAYKDKYFGFIPDKLFYSENDFPDFCSKETSKR